MTNAPSNEVDDGGIIALKGKEVNSKIRQAAAEAR